MEIHSCSVEAEKKRKLCEKAGVPFEVVPGITAGIAAPAYAGIPVTHRDYSSSFAIITGHRKAGEDDNIKWEAIAKGIDTIAIYMGVKNLPYIRKKLLEHGKKPDTPVALIHWGTLQNQRIAIGTLETIVDTAERELVENPSMIVIGEVVRFHNKINWFEKMKEETLLVNEVF